MIRRGLLLLVFLVPTALPADAARPRGWWNRKYAYRIRIALVDRPLNRSAPSARFRFGTGGRARSDFADVRVVTTTGREVPRKVIAHGPGDLVEIVFPLGEEKEWFVYHGDPDARPPRETYEPDRGLTLETRVRGPGTPSSWPAMEKILERSVRVIGGSSWKRVFDAENPFGPSDNYVSEYRGYVLAPRPGRYTFYTASDEASFLFVDGRLVAQWPGWHTAGRGAWGRFKGQIDLTKGLHPFRYVHVERRGPQVMAAYWLVPGAKKATVIPASCFPGHREVVVRGHEQKDGNLVADFTASTRDKWGLDNRVFEGLEFAARPTGSQAHCSWDFGDGVTAEGPSVYHVYLKGGDYDVRLDVREGGREDSVIRTIRVRAEWTRFDRNREAVLAGMASAAAGYPAVKMDPAAVERLVFLLDQAGREDDSIRVLRSVLRASTLLTRPEEYRLSMDLGRRYVDGTGDLAGAKWAFGKAAAVADRKEALLARAALADAAIRLGGDTAAATKLLESILATRGGNRGRVGRVVWLRLGDARMAAGDGAGARAAYERALELAGGPEDTRRLLRKAAEMRAALTRIEEGKPREALPYLAEWERDAPTDRFAGLHRIASAKALAALSRPEAALRELRPLVLSNPDSEYADQALALMAAIEESRGRPEEARALRERLKREYPWSPLNGK